MTEPLRVPHEELDVGDDQLMVWQGQPFTGVAVEFFPDGMLRSEVSFLEGVEHGLSREWYPAGQLKEHLTLWQGGIHGYARVWDEQGRLIHERRGEFGIRVAEKRWDEQGRLIQDWWLSPQDALYNTLQICRRNWAHLAPPLPWQSPPP